MGEMRVSYVLLTRGSWYEKDGEKEFLIFHSWIRGEKDDEKELDFSHD